MFSEAEQSKNNCKLFSIFFQLLSSYSRRFHCNRPENYILRLNFELVVFLACFHQFRGNVRHSECQGNREILALSGLLRLCWLVGNILVVFIGNWKIFCCIESKFFLSICFIYAFWDFYMNFNVVSLSPNIFALHLNLILSRYDFSNTGAKNNGDRGSDRSGKRVGDGGLWNPNTFWEREE